LQLERGTASTQVAAEKGTGKRSAQRTRQRVLDVSLALFNELGAPNVTTNHIADAAEISPGNLYYHYRHKEDIVLALYERYEAAVGDIVGGASGGAVDDLWLVIHLTFEVVDDFRFIHRDLSDLCTAYPALRVRFQRGLESGIERMSGYCRGLARAGEIEASPEEAHALAVNVSLVTTYWLNLQALRHASLAAMGRAGDDALSEGVFQVLSLITPYLRGERQEEFRRVARRYLPN